MATVITISDFLVLLLPHLIQAANPTGETVQLGCVCSQRAVSLYKIRNTSNASHIPSHVPTIIILNSAIDRGRHHYDIQYYRNCNIPTTDASIFSVCEKRRMTRIAHVTFVGSIATIEVYGEQCVTSPVPVNKSGCSAVPQERYKFNQNPKP
jgi:hypothetical protein